MCGCRIIVTITIAYCLCLCLCLLLVVMKKYSMYIIDPIGSVRSFVRSIVSSRFDCPFLPVVD